jgi:nonsense-mediated mRNA decay protein 3
MSESRAFCPRCGDSVEPRADEATSDREAANVRTTSGRAPLCEACFFREFDLVEAPDRIEVPVCSQCGAVKRGERWVDVGARDYTDVAIDEVSESLAIHVDAEAVSWGVDPEQVDENTIRMGCLVSGAVRGAMREREFTIPVLISRGTCDRCGRIAGEDYAATVQVRARGRTPEDDERAESISVARSYVADREDAGDRNAFITEIGERKEGVDVRVSTTQIGAAIADRIARRFGGDVDRSRTLVTEDGDGNEVYRMAYAVRLAPFRPGDVIDPAGSETPDPVVVESVRGNLKGVRLRSGEDYEASAEDGDAPDATVIGSIENAAAATLVAIEDERAIQVLDPETYETRTVRRPAGLDSSAETVDVLKAGGTLYPLPADVSAADG